MTDSNRSGTDPKNRTGMPSSGRKRLQSPSELLKTQRQKQPVMTSWDFAETKMLLEILRQYGMSDSWHYCRVRLSTVPRRPDAEV